MDVAELLSDVVTPVLDQLLRPGELDQVELEPPVTGPWPPTVAVRLRVVVVGEAFGFWAWTPGQVEETAPELRARLASDLQDHVAESRFGWSQLREYREP
ncbi:hypothetical protein KUM42_13740 [Modestobacter sp. L9-4]|uniref:hypothetical protein n=1 Tax=Modestobacter sp. L9-4 TaxID=2851567 RepID=UPI001C756CC8|nr:hypothetical protein [Modestobacter sp. L9-4]QXG74909.1 hypothetical protein KUM42_13740 [Modestobacter sp. L9-4]